MSKIYCLIGKSASGKDTVYREILSCYGAFLTPVIPYTTRPMRPGERNGVDYHFVTEDQLAVLEKEGRVIEKRCYQTTQGPWIYFTVDFPIEGDRILITTLVGAEKLMEYYGADKVCVIYLDADDKTRLLRYIERESLQKKPDYAEVCRRFLTDREDFAEERLAAFPALRRIFSQGSVSDCLEQWKKIYLEESQK